mgnify:CR=1 FL=1
MKFKYMFIDESGDLGTRPSSTKFLILSALIVDNPQELDRIIKNMRRNKFKKELSKASEIKANSSSASVIFYMLQKLIVIVFFLYILIFLKIKLIFVEKWQQL